VQRRGVAAEQQGLGRLGRGINENCAGGSEDLWQFLAHFLAQLVIEVGQRLIEQNEAGLLDDGAGQCGALLLAT
jgi:hypothetical protein